jgi:hypothetical protein
MTEAIYILGAVAMTLAVGMTVATVASHRSTRARHDRAWTEATEARRVAASGPLVVLDEWQSGGWRVLNDPFDQDALPEARVIERDDPPTREWRP